MATNTTLQEITPGILSMLPLFYIGWSDSVLSPSEMKIIHQRISDLEFLTDEEKEYLLTYTDPKSPPSAEVFKYWVETLQENAHDLSDIQRKSLAEIGVALAKSSTDSAAADHWHDPKTIAAIRTIQQSLGLENENSMKILLGQIDTPPDMPHEATFSPHKMQAILDGDNVAVISRVKKLLRDPYFHYQHLTDKAEKRKWTLERVQALAKQGLGAYAFPTEYGGGGRVGDHISVFETLAYGDLSVLIKFGVQFGLFGGAVYSLGTEVHHRKYLAALGSTDLLGCFAMTETSHGSNVKGLETTATYDHSTELLTVHSPNQAAGKEYIGNALDSTMAAVFCQLIINGENHGVHAVLVPLRDANHKLLPGVTVIDCGYKMGLNGVDNGRIWFDQVTVPRENLLNKYGSITTDGTYESPISNPNKRFFTMLGALVAGRVSVGLAGVNATKSALTIATRYANKRQQFAPKEGAEETIIMDYPSHQRRLIPRIAKTYGYYFALQKLAHDFVVADEDQQRKIETKAAGLKAMATWHATNTIQECREACGGKGYLSENKIDSLKADTDIFTTFEGDNTVLMQLVAKGLLTEFKQSFHDEGFSAVIRYLGSRVSNTMAEYNPIYRRNTSVEHLLDEEFHLHAFRYREKKLLITLSQRMQDYLKKRINPHDAFLKCQNHMIELAKAYIERLVLRNFKAKIGQSPKGPERDMLEHLCNLYALSVIEENKGWYLESDYMDGSKTKAIRRIVTKLCADLRQESNALVQAWGIPDELLGAAILD